MSQLFASGGQSIGASASASVLAMNIQGLFPLGWTGLISSQSVGLSRVFPSTPFERISSWHSASLYIYVSVTLSITSFYTERPLLVQPGLEQPWERVGLCWSSDHIPCVGVQWVPLIPHHLVILLFPMAP